MPKPQTHRQMTSPLWLNTCLLAACIWLSGCGGPGMDFTQPPPLVKISPVSVQPWQVTYTTSGTVEANNKVDLNAETAGIIAQLNFKEGQAVRRGQMLIRLKADKFLAQVGESAADIESARDTVVLQDAQIDQLQAMVEAAEARHKIAQDEYQRFAQLHQREFISALELNQKRSQLDTAVADLSAARQQLLGARAQRQQAISNLSRAKSTHSYSRAVAGETLIIAPFSGIIGQRFVALGDYVAPTEKLLTMVDNSVMRVMFAVPERYVGYLKAGLPVRVSFEGVSRHYAAVVDFVDPVVDEESRNVTVKAIIRGPDERIRHGQFGTVHLVLGTIDDAVVIPEEAVISQGEKRLVYVVKEEEAHLREILIGYREAGRVYVKSGLSAAERIITSGLQKVNDGGKVKEIEDTPGADPSQTSETPEKSQINTPQE